MRIAKEVRVIRGPWKLRPSADLVFSHSTETIGRVPFQYVTIFWYRKLLCSKGICHNLLAKFFDSQYQKLSWRNPSGFHKISGVEKLYGQVGVERVSQFSSKLFCLTMQKKYVGEPICAVIQNIYVSENFHG